MRNLNIDEEFDFPVEIDREQMIEEIATSSKFSDENIEYDDFVKIISECLDKNIENHTHINGKVYIDDWSEFDEDLEIMINESLEKYYDN